MITLDLVEELLVGVILGTGDKDAGWGETAEKLAEILEPVRELNLKSLYITNFFHIFSISKVCHFSRSTTVNLHLPTLYIFRYN